MMKIDPAHREALAALDALIRKEAPGLEPAKGTLAYGKYHYRYDSGREGDSYVISLASRKNGISMYVSAVADGKYLPEARAAELGKVNVGKSCIRFKRLDDLNLPALRKLVRDAAKLKPPGAV
jgi:hypothetical protein